MMFPFKRALLLTLVVVTAGFVPLSASAAEGVKEVFSAEQKTALEPIIKDYILAHPEVILEAVDKHRAQQEEAAMKESEKSIVENLAWLTDAKAPSAGNPKGDVTIVEFFDYNCGYCIKALNDVQAILKEDQNVRFVFRELSILGPTSRTAAQWSLAAHKQGKYFEYHVATMHYKGPKEAGDLEKIAKGLGLDTEKMKKDIASGEIDKALDETADISRKIGVNGTPAFIVGTTFIPGYIGEEGLKKALADERAKAKK